METLTKMFATIAGVVVATVFSSYYIWQFIMGVPFLQSVLAYSTTITIVLVEVISIVWYASHVRHKMRVNDAMYDNLPGLSPRDKQRQIH